MPLRDMEISVGPDGIFVYGGARCNPAGVSQDLPILSRIHEVVTLFSQNFHKKFRIFSLHADVGVLAQCRREPADAILAKLTKSPVPPE
jgi:hypothetical protein